jgi:hypothetical protein
LRTGVTIEAVEGEAWLHCCADPKMLPMTITATAHAMMR